MQNSSKLSKAIERGLPRTGKFYPSKMSTVQSGERRIRRQKERSYVKGVNARIDWESLGELTKLIDIGKIVNQDK